MCRIELNPDNFNPQILFFFEKGFDLKNSPPCHSHEFISLIYIISGSCTYMINEKPFSVGRGDLLLIKPGVSHQKLFTVSDEVTEFQIGFNNISMKTLVNDNCSSDEIPVIYNFSEYDEDFLKCCREINIEQKNEDLGSGLVIKTLVMKFIALFIKAVHSEKKYQYRSEFNFEPYDRSNTAKAVASFIDSNYMNKISLDGIAKNMYLSPAYLSKIFKEETGESPINYLIRIRLSKAKKLLQENSVSVKAAASSVGYSDIYHFSKLFKKYYGNPPSIYSLKKQN